MSRRRTLLDRRSAKHWQDSPTVSGDGNSVSTDVCAYAVPTDSFHISSFIRTATSAPLGFRLVFAPFASASSVVAYRCARQGNLKMLVNMLTSFVGSLSLREVTSVIVASFPRFLNLLRQSVWKKRQGRKILSYEGAM